MSKLQSKVESVCQLAEEIISGRGQFTDGGAKLFQSGANSAITGDMLTTTGTSIADDIEMFKRLGYEL